MENKPVSPYLIPLAIVFAGVIIAGSVLYAFRNGAPSALAQQNGQARVAPPITIPLVTAADHIFGNPKAKVVLVEYSDTECPFCKRMHETMISLMKDYEATGDVAWIYRSMPLDQLHKKARLEAAATECAAEMGGNDLFWKYIGKIFEITPSNDGLDPNALITTAEQLGLNGEQFKTCVESGKFDGKIQQSIDEAVKSGAQGTPWSVVMTANGKKKETVDGALPAAAIKATIEKLLKS